MANLVVVGAQWGDEGKGKIVDLLTDHFDVIARYQGGHNAGHTVIIDGKKYILHLIPSGILHAEKICVIGNGVVVDLLALKKELEELRAAGVHCEGRLRVSNRAHLILDYHRLMEASDERRRGGNRIGTTNRGVGPAYQDKIGRRGVRISTLADEEVFRSCLRENIDGRSDLTSLGELDLEEVASRNLALGEELSGYFADTATYLNQAMNEGKSVLFEGAQGTLLDVDHGTYPFVTSSSATAGGACTGTGVGPTRIDGIVGIAKAYTTRVGEGPFPTELTDGVGEEMRRRGEEFGASTGRPRRCGWFDAVIVGYSCLVNNFDTLVITKLDVLDQFPEIKICTGYRYKGSLLESFPPDIHVLDECRPEYETVKGWMGRTAGVREFNDLPALAKDYLKRLSDLLQVEIPVVSTGPDRQETVLTSSRSRMHGWVSFEDVVRR